MTDTFIELLKKLAKKETCFDNLKDGEAPGYYCGNEDDAYQFGHDDGQIELARTVLKELDIKDE